MQTYLPVFEFLDTAAYMMEAAGIQDGEYVLDAVLRCGDVHVKAKDLDDRTWELVQPAVLANSKTHRGNILTTPDGRRMTLVLINWPRLREVLQHAKEPGSERLPEGAPRQQTAPPIRFRGVDQPPLPLPPPVEPKRGFWTEDTRNTASASPNAPLSANAGAAEAAVAYRTGLPGKPTSWFLVEVEARRRWGEGERHAGKAGESATKWAVVLIDWLKNAHRDAPLPKPKTLRNRLAPLLRSLESAEPKP